MITLTPGCLSELRSDAERRYPEECCGLLLGLEPGPDPALEPSQAGARAAGQDGPDPPERTAVAALATFNGWEDENRRRRFRITSEDFLLAEAEAAARGLEVVGVYHSHPDHPARPSAYDLEQAWPFYSYLILGVDQGRVAKVASFRLQGDRSAFTEEAVAVIGPAPADPIVG
jgi:proteasome lid subunit RPN8/RPN11